MWIIADVVFDTDAEAREAERLAREGKLAGISVDPGGIPDAIYELRGTQDAPEEWTRFTRYEIGAATIVPIPAYKDARIEFTDEGPIAFLVPEGVDTGDRRTFDVGAVTWREKVALMWTDTNMGHEGGVHVGNLTNFRREMQPALVAAGAPSLSSLTKPRIDEGLMIGHGAGWGTCHTAFRDACVTAPSSPAYGVMPVYQHPRGDHHAPLHLSAEAARAWYDANCELVATVATGEDDFGIWVAGECTLDRDECFLSGDWRSVDGELQLISFLVVENPGFPTALVASDHQNTLVAAGIVQEVDELALLRARVESLELDQRADRILASI